MAYRLAARCRICQSGQQRPCRRGKRITFSQKSLGDKGCIARFRPQRYRYSYLYAVPSPLGLYKKSVRGARPLRCYGGEKGYSQALESEREKAQHPLSRRGIRQAQPRGQETRRRPLTLRQASALPQFYPGLPHRSPSLGSRTLKISPGLDNLTR
jgi:hypothetical protein